MKGSCVIITKETTNQTVTLAKSKDTSCNPCVSFDQHMIGCTNHHISKCFIIVGQNSLQILCLVINSGNVFIANVFCPAQSPTETFQRYSLKCFNWKCKCLSHKDNADTCASMMYITTYLVRIFCHQFELHTKENWGSTWKLSQKEFGGENSGLSYQIHILNVDKPLYSKVTAIKCVTKEWQTEWNKITDLSIILRNLGIIFSFRSSTAF